MKRLFDLLAAVLGLLLLSPILVLIGLAIQLDSPGPLLYRGKRISKGGKPFTIYKFRTMVADAARIGGGLTHRDDPRITRFGRFLRRTKLDELPQLLNVVQGEMSLVGPRPEDPRYVEFYTERQRRLLNVRPGMTSIATLRYRQEEQLLPPASWEKVYAEAILPAKLDLELNYLDKQSLGQDLMVLGATIFALLRDLSRLSPIVKIASRIELFIVRYVSWAVVDAVLILIAYSLAILIRSLDASVDVPLAFRDALRGLAFYIVANYVFGIYNRAWRYASGQESVLLFASTGTATVALMVVGLSMQTRELPLGAIVIGGLLTFLFMAAVRYRRRIFRGVRDAVQSFSGFASEEGARVLIIGAGEEGQLLAWQLQNRMPGNAYQVVGFVDVDRSKHGLLIHNVRVYGDRRLIPDLAQKLHVDLIIIAIPQHEVREPRELLALCRATHAQVKILPGLASLLDRNGHEPFWVDADEEELLRRERYRVDEVACTSLVAGKVVMVTGAAGSIGSELCRQIAAFGASRLVLVDIDESGLHDLQVELQTKLHNIALRLALCDITDRCGMESIFVETRPQLVFHVAAYKHVPILEEQPREGIRVNVSGTRVMHSLAHDFGVERFILISSDKAVNPTNVLGLTKRLGELIVTSPEANGTMLSAAVRFGNVLGSRGSVIPTFEKQIDLGGPITITDPSMTRYFLSIGEAVGLVIQAVSMTSGGDIYILDMGVPVRILDLAQRLIRMRGLRPGQDIAIKYTGVRAGEKMNEQLVGTMETRVPTEHPSIFRIEQSGSLDLQDLDRRIDKLVELSSDGAPPPVLRDALRACVDSTET